MRLLLTLLRGLAGLLQFSLYTLIFFVLMAGAGYWVALEYFGAEEVETPNLTGLSTVEALVQLQDLNISLELERRQPSIEFPEGHIVNQYPKPGTMIKTGTPVRVVISEGQPLVTVPQLVGSNKIEAGIRLRKLGLDVGNIATIPRDGVPGGTVLTTDPPAGAGVVEGTRVNLMLAEGESSRVRQMPNLVGLTREEARQVMASYGLEISAEREQVADGVPVGEIHSQIPSPGSRITPDTQITVFFQPPRAIIPPQPESPWSDAFLRSTTPTGTDEDEADPESIEAPEEAETTPPTAGMPETEPVEISPSGLAPETESTPEAEVIEELIEETIGERAAEPEAAPAIELDLDARPAAIVPPPLL